ncbi:MAG: sigma-70 family RNA polymerase sigma factor [Acidobacteriota bacterium]
MASPRDLNGDDWSDLVARLRDGDEGALRQLIDRNWNPMVSWLRTALVNARGAAGSPDDAEDLALDVFHRFWRALGSGRGPEENEQAAWIAYLKAAARNSFRDARARRHLSSVMDPESTGLEAQDPDGEARTWTRELQEHVRRCLSELEPRLQTLVVEHVLNEIPISQLAEVWSTAASTLRDWRSKALSQLGKCLKPVTASFSFD